MAQRRGRPPALDANKRSQVVAMVSVGASRTIAARFVGVSVSTVRHHAIHDRAFRDRLRQAELGAEVNCLRNLQLGQSRSWRAAAWSLERLFPERYAKRQAGMIRMEDMEEVLDGVSKLLVDMLPKKADRQRLTRTLGMLTETVKQRQAETDPLLNGQKPRKKTAIDGQDARRAKHLSVVAKKDQFIGAGI